MSRSQMKNNNFSTIVEDIEMELFNYTETQEDSADQDVAYEFLEGEKPEDMQESGNFIKNEKQAEVKMSSERPLQKDGFPHREEISEVQQTKLFLTKCGKQQPQNKSQFLHFLWKFTVTERWMDGHMSRLCCESLGYDSESLNLLSEKQSHLVEKLRTFEKEG